MSQPPGASPTSTPGTRPATAGVTVKVRTRDSFPLFEIFGERRHMAAFAWRQRHPTASLGVLPLASYWLPIDCSIVWCGMVLAENGGALPFILYSAQEKPASRSRESAEKERGKIERGTDTSTTSKAGTPNTKGSRLLPLLCGEIAWFFLVCVFLLNKTASQSGRQTAYVLPTRRTVCV